MWLFVRIADWREVENYIHLKKCEECYAIFEYAKKHDFKVIVDEEGGLVGVVPLKEKEKLGGG